MLQQDLGRTAEVLRQDREARHLEPKPSGAPAMQPMSMESAGDPKTHQLGRVPTGFDPYLMNGRGPNDDSQEIISTFAKKPWSCCGAEWHCSIL